MSKVITKDTTTTSLTFSSVLIVDFEHVFVANNEYF